MSRKQEAIGKTNARAAGDERQRSARQQVADTPKPQDRRRVAGYAGEGGLNRERRGEQSFRLVQSEHDIHILNRLPGSTLDQVVDGRDQYEPMGMCINF